MKNNQKGYRIRHTQKTQLSVSDSWLPESEAAMVFVDRLSVEGLTVLHYVDGKFSSETKWVLIGGDPKVFQFRKETDSDRMGRVLNVSPTLIVRQNGQYVYDLRE